MHNYRNSYVTKWTSTTRCLLTALSELLNTTLPELLGMVRRDSDRQLVIGVLEQLKAMLDNIKMPLLYDQTITDELISIIKIVIHRKVSLKNTSLNL